jgi:hypothetical protein
MVYSAVPCANLEIYRTIASVFRGKGAEFSFFLYDGRKIKNI